MMVNGIEQVRQAMLALPGALEVAKGPSDGESWSQTVVTAIDDSVGASINLVAQHIGDKVVDAPPNNRPRSRSDRPVALPRPRAPNFATAAAPQRQRGRSLLSMIKLVVVLTVCTP